MTINTHNVSKLKLSNFVLTSISDIDYFPTTGGEVSGDVELVGNATKLLVGNTNKVGSRFFNVVSCNAATMEISIGIADGIDIQLAIGKKYSLYSTGSAFNIGTVIDAFNSSDDVAMLSVDTWSSKLNVGAELFFNDMPEFGVYDNPVTNAISQGRNNVIYADYASSFGSELSSIGKYAHTEGRKNLAEWGCHAENDRNIAYGVANHVEGRSNFIMPNDEGNRPYVNHVDGYGNTVVGAVKGSTVQGVASEAKHNNSYVWSGVLEPMLNGALPNYGDADYIPQTRYKSHQDGSFNINPVNGIQGFYIGDKSLMDIIERQLAPVYDLLDSTFTGNIYTTVDGRKYDPIDSSVSQLSVYPYDKSQLISLIKVSDQITAITGSCFNACTNLTSVNIADSNITTLGEKVFQSTSLISCYMPKNCTTCGKQLFAYCTKLQYIYAPDNITPTQMFHKSAMYRRCQALDLIDGQHNTNFTMDACQNAISGYSCFMECFNSDGSTHTIVVKCYDGDLSCLVSKEEGGSATIVDFIQS